ncbi:hypothetical protein ACJMK2_002919 [Sinanodonta woodiana]|uniref:C-type lectin domain-containing protein n=1 Tax=Sinanodonta woodiana TaxID=1069815 RepID=A0ABD3Y011_SINWO
MNLVQIGFVSLTLLALADGFTLTSGGGFGGISGIFGVLLILIFIAALGKRTNTCPGNYTHTPNDPTSCIRFINAPTKKLNDAYAACDNDGGQLLMLSTASFPIIQNIARNNSGMCDYWVQTVEGNDGLWIDINNNYPTPTTPGLFFINPTNGHIGDCGLMDNTIDFFVSGADCNELHCYICQKYI